MLWLFSKVRDRKEKQSSIHNIINIKAPGFKLYWDLLKISQSRYLVESTDVDSQVPEGSPDARY